MWLLLAATEKLGQSFEGSSASNWWALSKLAVDLAYVMVPPVQACSAAVRKPLERCAEGLLWHNSLPWSLVSLWGGTAMIPPRWHCWCHGMRQVNQQPAVRKPSQSRAERLSSFLVPPIKIGGPAANLLFFYHHILKLVATHTRILVKGCLDG